MTSVKEQNKGLAELVALSEKAGRDKTTASYAIFAEALMNWFRANYAALRSPARDTVSTEMIENRRNFLRGITDPDDWVDVLCDLALAALRANREPATEAVRPLFGDQPVGTERYAYLIERGQKVGHSPTIWWKGDNTRIDETYETHWTQIANKARRFVYARDAQRLAETLFEPGTYSITDHVFLDRALKGKGASQGVDGEQDYKALYYELLYAVGNKYPGETRHQTALRYIRYMESPPTIAAASPDEQKGRP
jgi:hypothetical protein